ncbi:FAD-dependent oxidoreductase, partial [Alloalcanivorax venustensis]|uniref:FAD-dependent oxidoreductase n=1 Tax=Alloalcanivorax venustensis TaxID=172371 RepID=UPI0035166C35
MTVSVTSPVLKPDILIFGGGIAGLWLINHLQQRGYQCLLLETGTLGGAQTLASQGIIHGGLKYALGGTLSSESEAIAGMPDRWRQAIDGQGPVDLSGLRLATEPADQRFWVSLSTRKPLRFTGPWPSMAWRQRSGMP